MIIVRNSYNCFQLSCYLCSPQKNAVRDMKKVRKHFAVSEKSSIFANAIIENTGSNAHFDILHDRQERADLIESGKFMVNLNGPKKVALKSSLVCPVSFLKDTDCFAIFVLRVITRTLSGEYVREACPSFIKQIY